MLKEENARFCAPKTRIPTPAAKKTVAATQKRDFMSKIPSPRSVSPSDAPPKQSQSGGSSEEQVAAVPAQEHQHAEAQDTATAELTEETSPQMCTAAFRSVVDAADIYSPYSPFATIATEALQLSQDLASPLGATTQRELLRSTADSHDQAAGGHCTHMPQQAASPQTAGLGTPLDFSSVLNLEGVPESEEQAAVQPRQSHVGMSPLDITVLHWPVHAYTQCAFLRSGSS